MGKLLLVLQFLIILYLNAFSSTVDINQAQDVAINFMNSKNKKYNNIINIHEEKYQDQVVYYIVNFQNGGWVLVSSENSIKPILGYNKTGEFSMGGQKPPALQDLISSYKSIILHSRERVSQSDEVENEWIKLLGKTTKMHEKSSSDDNLLNDPERGEVVWDQGENYWGGCTPSYNQYCPSGGSNNSACDKRLAGCGAVAMGQIMWYWQWPGSSIFREYNWNLMQTALYNSNSTMVTGTGLVSTPEQGSAVANLLRDIGQPEAANIRYWGTGSWTTTNDIVDAFRNVFQYNAVKKQVKNDWLYGNAWLDLIRSEIDCKRPVFYRGDKSDASFDKHFFVCDGYDSELPYLFHFNWGWSGKGNGYYSFDNLVPTYLGDILGDFNKNQMAVVGISPTYDISTPNETNIYDVDYSTISNEKTVEAQQNISLPKPTKNLTIEDGANVDFNAGISIVLNPGFHSKQGSTFECKIEPQLQEDVEIKVQQWNNVFTPNGDGYNDQLCFDIENADSWEFQAFDINSNAIYQSAGIIQGDEVCVWDGSGAYCEESYLCVLRFKNSYGRAIEKVYQVVLVCGSKSSLVDTTSNSISRGNIATVSVPESEENNYIQPLYEIYPNPSFGDIHFAFNTEIPTVINVYSMNGQLLHRIEGIQKDNFDYHINYKGLLIIKILFEGKLFTEKIIIE